MTTTPSRAPICFTLVLLAGLGWACGDDKETPDAEPELIEVDDFVDESSEPDEVEETEMIEDDPLAAPFRVAFTYRDPDNPDEAVRMYLLDTADHPVALTNTKLAALTSGIDCDLGACLVTTDLRYFLYHQGDLSLRIAPIVDGAVAAADLSLLAANVDDVQLAGNRVAYIADNMAYFVDLSGALGAPVEIGQVIKQLDDGVDYIGGGIAVAERGDKLLLYRYDRGSLGVFRVGTDGSNETLLFRLGVPRGSGSQYGGQNPFVVSADGRTAVALIEGMMLYDICTTNQGCADVPEGSCMFYTNEQGVQSSNGLCGSSQRTLQSFALDNDDLGKRCASDSECDPRHQCAVDPTSLIITPQSRCVPRSYVIALRSAQGCEVASATQFTDVVRKLRMSTDDQVVFLGLRDCPPPDVGGNAVMSIDLGLDPASLKALEGPYDHDWGQRFCYDEQEDRWAYDDCALLLQDFDLAPNGGLVVRASGLSDNNGRELWLIDRDGTKYPATDDIFYDVASLFAVVP